MSWLEPFLHWLAVHTGTLNEPGPYYGFWSGFGSDLGEVAIIGGLVTVARKHNCHEKGCWRIGKHVVSGSPWCSRHHEAARAAAAPAPVPLEARFAVLIESIDGLAEAIRTAMLVAPRQSGKGAHSDASG